MQCRKTLRQKLKAFVDSTKILRRSKDNMNKKFLSLVLALVMVLGTLTPVFAEEAAPKDKIEKAAKTAPSAKVQWLVDEKIVSGRKLFKDGDEKTDLSLDKNLQRDEITRLLVLGKGLENLANLVQGTMRPYVDVDNSNWANGVITVGSYHLKNTQGVPMLAGYPGNKFLPTRNVSYAELAKMLVCLVDNSITPKMVEKFQWPSDWMVRAANLGILAGVEVKDSKAFVTRQAAFEMLYNAMYLYDTRHNVDYGTKMGVVSGYANGELRLNQGDKAFTVKLNASTLYVNNSGFVGQNALHMWNGNSTLWVGSLVRVICDKDGNATHIVELGNPNEGAIAGRWYGVADKIAEGYADFAKGNAKDGNTLSIYNNTFMTQSAAYAHQDAAKNVRQANFNAAIAKAGVEKKQVTLTKETRFFVADPRNNFLTEIDKAKAQELVNKAYYEDELGYFPNVYVGYDENMRGNVVVGSEARVVVFNVVNDEFADAEYVRVLNPSNGMYEFTAENTKGEPTAYSLRHYAGSMPGFERSFQNSSNKAGYNHEFEKLNVIKIVKGVDTKDVVRAGIVIEYASAPSFKVVGFDSNKFAGYYTLQLQGVDGRVLKDVKLNAYKTKIFNANQFANLENKWIQVENSQLVKNANGEYALKNANNVITGAVSILEQPMNWAKLDPAYAQDKNFRIVRISDIKEDTTDNWLVKVDQVRYNTSADKHSQVQFDSARWYRVLKSDAKFIYDALYDNTGARKAIDKVKVESADFEAEVVIDAAGQITKIEVNRNVAPKLVYPMAMQTEAEVTQPAAPAVPVQ